MLVTVRGYRVKTDICRNMDHNKLCSPKHIFFLNFVIPKTYQIAPLCSSRYVICTSCFFIHVLNIWYLNNF